MRRKMTMMMNKLMYNTNTISSVKDADVPEECVVCLGLRAYQINQCWLVHIRQSTTVRSLTKPHQVSIQFIYILLGAASCTLYNQITNMMSSLHFLRFLKCTPGERDTNTSVAFDELVDEILEDEALERLFQSIIDADVGDENRALNR